MVDDTEPRDPDGESPWQLHEARLMAENARLEARCNWPALCAARLYADSALQEGLQASHGRFCHLEARYYISSVVSIQSIIRCV